MGESACPHCNAAHGPEVLFCPETGRGMPLEGRILDGKFRLIRRLGRGGMGEVWEAEHETVRKRVAIKVMHAQYARDPRILKRFRNEATSAGRIGNRHICDIFDLGDSPLGPYIVMERLDGVNMADLCKVDGPLPVGDAVWIACQALIGLGAAHSAGIVHRDLKPENIFLDRVDGKTVVKLLDFGVSKFAETGGSTAIGTLVGTPEYMSPEQTEGANRANPASDLWSLAVILYEAISGVSPFRGSTLAATLQAVIERDPTPLSSLCGIDAELSAAIARGMERSEEHRYFEAAAMAEALAPFAEIDAERLANRVDAAYRSTVSGAAPAGDGAAPSPEATPARPKTPAGDPSWHMGDGDVPEVVVRSGRGPLWALALVGLLGVAAAFSPPGQQWIAELRAQTSGDGGGDTEDPAAASTSGPSDPLSPEAGTGTGTGGPATGSGSAADASPSATTSTSSGAATSAAEAASSTSGAPPAAEGGDDASSGPDPTPTVPLLSFGRRKADPRVVQDVGFREAVRHCRGLRKDAYGGLERWSLPRARDIRALGSKLDPGTYWTATGDRTRAAAVKLPGGKLESRGAREPAKAVCVSR